MSQGKAVSNHCYLIFSLPFLALLCWMISNPQSAAAQERMELFSPESVTAAEAASVANPAVWQKINEQVGDYTLRRHRYARSGYHYLTERSDPAGSKDLLALNLFEDLSVAALKESETRRGEQEFTWFGKIVGARYSQVVLVVKDDNITGNIWIGDKLYQVRPLGDGVHSIGEIDQAFFPGEETILQPEYGADQPASPNLPGEASAGITYLDILVVYTPLAQSSSTDIEREIRLAVDEANASYAGSGIGLELRLIYTAPVGYSESGSFTTDLSRLQGNADGFMDDVHLWRDSYGADLVCLWVEYGSPGSCGTAYQMTAVSSAFQSLAFSVVRRYCATGNLDFAHELGHNLGARHDWFTDPLNNSPYTYNHGYVNVSEGWRTIMALENQCGGSCVRLPFWSNPDLAYPVTGSPTGIPEGSPNAADNRKTLQNTASTVAAFRSAPAAYLHAAPAEVKTGYLAGEKEISVSNIGSGIMIWNASVAGGASWLSIVSGGSGIGNEKIRIAFDENGSPASRQGTLQISSFDAVNSPIEVTVTQFGVQSFAPLPYSTGFESGSLDQYWRTASDHGNGRIQVTTANSPHSGNYHLTLDVSTSGAFVTNEAWLHLDLSGNANAELKFWWKDFDDETHLRDGVYFSDDAGGTFVKILDLWPNAYSGWMEFTLDLDSLAGLHGMSLTRWSVIKFQQYDEFPVTSDGFAFDDISVVNADLKLYAKAWLEGPYRLSSHDMNTYLADQNLLPLSQPFGDAPWNYPGAESVASIPADAVDWMLVELRSEVSEAAAADTQVAFIKKNGSVVGLDGASPLKFDLKEGSYYIALYHRNHLAIMSNAAQALSKTSAISYDFTTAQNRAYGTQPMKRLETGVFGMRAGDANADGSVTLSDRVFDWRPQNGTAWEYLKAGDFNLDGGIDAADLDLYWRTNEGRSTWVP